MGQPKNQSKREKLCLLLMKREKIMTPKKREGERKPKKKNSRKDRF